MYLAKSRRTSLLRSTALRRSIVFSLAISFCLSAQPAPPKPAAAKPPPAPPIKPKPEELKQVLDKTDELSVLVASLRVRKVSAELLADVDIYQKAGRILLEIPEDFGTQAGIDNTLSVLDVGLQRARDLLDGKSPWVAGKRRTHGFYSALDGSVQPYGVSVPDSYDGTKPVRLYVNMHGRAAKLTEADFLFAHPNGGPGKPPVADHGQIQMDVYGRWNSAGYHFAGEADVFEAMAAVQKRYKIDPDRIILRGFSMGGEGAWHIALHHPDRFAAAEIGAGTWSRRSEMPGLPDYQKATLRIWENMHEWALNAFNLPIAGHDGDNDTQTCCLPPHPPGTKNRGQLESSIKVREQLVKEGYPSEGEPNNLSAKGTPSIFLISADTGHGTSPLVRQQLDAFLKKHGDRGRVSPDRLRFVTYTARYNKSFWATLDMLQKHYERSEIDAERMEGGKSYRIATRNLSRLTLTETTKASRIEIDGEKLTVKGSPSIVLDRSSGKWQAAKQLKPGGLHKVHGLQGPIDDAFLEPFVCVRPTGTPWNEAVNQQALKALARFDGLYLKFFRAHPRIVDDKDFKASDFAKYHVILFGDPGSNSWIAKLNGKLPVQWTRDQVTFKGQSYPAGQHYPAMIYPNPLSPAKYVVLNTALTITDREYRGDYGMPRWGDYAIVKVGDYPEIPDTATAGLFDEHWK